MVSPILGLYGVHVDIADRSKPIKNERFQRKSWKSINLFKRWRTLSQAEKVG